MNAAVNYRYRKNSVLQISVNNILDREFYADDGTAGRTYNVGLRYSF